MDARLLPCPECGAAVEVKASCYAGTETLYSYAHCTNPKCILHAHTAHFSDCSCSPERNQEDAIRSWNERYAGTEPRLRRRDTQDSERNAGETASS